MRTDMRGKDFVTLMDFTGEEIETILEVGFDLKRQNAVGAEHELLKNKTLGMILHSLPPAPAYHLKQE